jgi:peptide/nickel transport system substrate-binding protein
MLSPSERPLYSQMAQVARDLFLKLGLNADFQPLDWGTVIARRTNRNAVERGGWSTFSIALEGMPINNPGSNFALRGGGAAGSAGR